MNLLRKLLFPFSILYGIVIWLRNFLYDKGVLQSHSFDLPVIAVGNLSVGGTGKTPQIEYLIRLLSNHYQVATLSRGYKRKSKGFILANADVNATILGDEPYQFFQKFAAIQVAVDSDRKNGIEQLLLQSTKPEVILLDDAFQHRKLQAGFYILLTSYGDLYANDFMLPTGNLREPRKGAKRASIIVVTKCPKNLAATEQESIKKQLCLSENQSLFFSYIAYDDCIYSKNSTVKLTTLKENSKLLLAGIANPEFFFNQLKQEGDECLTFADHHHFSESEIKAIQTQAKDRIIITTEKDYVRLKDSILVEQLYYLPIQSSFVTTTNEFDTIVLDFVKKTISNI